MPGWPVNYSCDQAKVASDAHKSDEYAALYPIEAAASVYYNYNNQLKCLDLNNQDEGGISQSGWNVLSCHELSMPFASRETTSMFPSYEWNKVSNTAWCESAYGLRPEYNWPFTHYGGLHPTKDFMSASNIVFSNGALDPWHAGGVTFNVSENTTFLYIEQSAHHLDLRLPNEQDPATVTAARATETLLIAGWID